MLNKHLLRNEQSLGLCLGIETKVLFTSMMRYERFGPEAVSKQASDFVINAAAPNLSTNLVHRRLVSRWTDLW